MHGAARRPGGVTAASEPSRWLRMRRWIDRFLAAVLLAGVAPAIGVLAILVRLDDRGPAFIAVPRVGQGGQVFGMWKIRSMRVERQDGRALGAVLTNSEDPRITRMGRIVRGTHLDELPQLLNVVRGQMLLLGPRPEAPEYVDIDETAWVEALQVPPGIAGPTQLVVGDWELTQIDLDESGTAYRRVVLPVKLGIDRWYVRSASPSLDLLIVRTLLVSVLRGGDAAGLRRTVEHSVPAASAARTHEERSG